MLRHLKRMQRRDVPLLQPLTILNAKYIEQYNFVVLKLKFPDGREALAASPYREEGKMVPGLRWGILPPNHDSFLARIVGRLLTAVPAGLTPQEIETIRKKSIFIGMSRVALIYSRGFPEAEDDWGMAGRQLIFLGAQVLVYLDSAGRVADVQVLDK